MAAEDLLPEGGFPADQALSRVAPYGGHHLDGLDLVVFGNINLHKIEQAYLVFNRAIFNDPGRFDHVFQIAYPAPVLVLSLFGGFVLEIFAQITESAGAFDLFNQRGHQLPGAVIEFFLHFPDIVLCKFVVHARSFPYSVRTGVKRGGQASPPLTEKQYSTGRTFGQKKLVKEEDILYSKDLRRNIKKASAVWRNGMEKKQKDVVISIHSVHGYDQNDTEELDFTTDGVMSLEEDGCSLSYMESEVTGMPGTLTTFRVNPDGIVVDREGFVTSRMQFREGMKDSVMLATPYGTARLGIDTRKIRNNLGCRGGNLEIEYVVNMEHVVAMRNRFIIDVKEQGAI